MTFDEALAKLGLSRHTSRDQARRAYLRHLKTTRPEVDRDAFIALRDAYEIVQALLPPQASQEAASDAGATPAARSAQVEALPLAAEGVEPIQPGSDQPAADVSPVAIDEPRVAVVEPDLANNTEIGSGAPPEAAGRALTPTEAAARMSELFDRFGHDPSLIPPLIEAMRLTLICLAQNEIASALALNKRVSAWLQRSGRETALGPALLTTWITTRELAKLAPEISPRVFVPIAEAALNDDLKQASQALVDFRDARPHEARAALSTMKLHAPWLATTVGWSLAAPPPAPKWWTKRRGGGWVATLVFLAAMRLISFFVTKTEHETRSEWSRSAHEARVSPAVVENARRNVPTWIDEGMKVDAGRIERFKHALGLFFQLSDSVADALKSCQMTPEVELVRRVKEEVRNGNCLAAEGSMSKLRDAAKSSASEKERCASEHVLAFDRSFAMICREAENLLPIRKPE